MIVVDSSVWIDVFKGRVTPQTVFLDNMEYLTDVILGDLVLLEILQGANSEKDAQFLQSNLQVYGVTPMLTPSVAVIAAQNFRRLRRVGKTIRKTTDLIIGTYCIENGHSLLHADRDFLPMAEHLGLDVIDA